MSDCSTNAMSAPKPIHGEIVWKDGMRPTPLSYARYVNGVERVADHIDFDGERYERVRTCEDTGRYCFTCSKCGWTANEPRHAFGGFWPKFCPNCSARVRGGGDD